LELKIFSNLNGRAKAFAEILELVLILSLENSMENSALANFELLTYLVQLSLKIEINFCLRFSGTSQLASFKTANSKNKCFFIARDALDSVACHSKVHHSLKIFSEYYINL
jgi:hypothetical protein